jgi:hypothetical protein
MLVPPELPLPVQALGLLGMLLVLLRLPRYTVREYVWLRVYARWHLFNRRTTPDRRVMQQPYEGPERRSGRERRSLVVAL